MHVLHTRPPHHRRYRVESLAYSPDGEFLLVGIDRRERECWATDREGRLLRLDPRGRTDEELERVGETISDVAWSEDGTRVAAVGGGRLAVLTRDFETVARVPLPYATAVTFGVHQEVIVTLSRHHGGGVLRLDPASAATAPWCSEQVPSALGDEWSGPRGLGLRFLRGSVSATIHPDYGLIVGGRDGVWIEEHAGSKARVAGAGWFETLDLSPDSRVLAAAAVARVFCWSVGESSLDGRRELVGHRKEVTALAFSPDGRFLLSTSLDGTVRLWDPASGREVACLDWGIGPVRSLACHPDGTTAAVGGGRRDAIVVFDLP